MRHGASHGGLGGRNARLVEAGRCSVPLPASARGGAGRGWGPLPNGMGMEERVWHRFYRPGARRSLSYPEAPVFQLLDARARQNPDLIALAFYGQQIPYGELAALTRRMANGLLALGLEPGDRVMIMVPNSPAYVIAYYGVLRAGGIVTQVNPLYVEREIEFLARDSGARWIVTAGEL